MVRTGKKGTGRTPFPKEPNNSRGEFRSPRKNRRQRKSCAGEQASNIHLSGSRTGRPIYLIQERGRNKKTHPGTPKTGGGGGGGGGGGLGGGGGGDSGGGGGG